MRRVIFVLFLLIIVVFSGNVINKNTSRHKVGAIIDWVDFIMINDISYDSIYDSDAALDAGHLDKVYAKVTHKVADNVSDPEYKTKNGDAAFLEVGTPVYTIKGYSPNFRLAAYNNGKIIIYEAYRNPNAVKGKDMLDIKDKVKYISINSETDGKTELGRIEDRELVDKLVNMLLEAQVRESDYGDGQRYFICFHLTDGTNVNRAYWINSGVMSFNMRLPAEFGEEISKVLGKMN